MIFHLSRIIKKELGKNISISALCAPQNFYLFFHRFSGDKVKKLIVAFAGGNFNDEWDRNTPYEKKYDDVMSALELKANDIIGDHINVGGMPFITQTIPEIEKTGEQHGRSFAETNGEALKGIFPNLVEQDKSLKEKLAFRKTYEKLTNDRSITPQKRGIEFETLWREILDFYGWVPRKIRLSGEENDFTAIYQTTHILGEVRWYDESMNGDKVRSFSAKLDARPQTVGLMISHSGFDKGAVAVARRVIHSKTIVFFDQKQIDKIIVKLVSPGLVFEEELRKVYDFIFEE